MQGRAVSWLKAARKAFEEFPDPVKIRGLQALVIAADGGYPDIAKPLTGLGQGLFELRLNDRAGTYRVVYAVKVGDDLWVIHAFQKKSKTGIKTPRNEIELIQARLKSLKELLS
jgi:phage-related protein